MGQQTIKTKCTWTEECGIVYTLLQLSNGTVASGIDKLIKIWDFRNNNYVCILILEGHTDTVSSLLEIKENNCLLSGSGDHTIRYWNLTTNQCLTVIDIHFWTISSIIELENNRMVTSSWDHTIIIWNSISYKHISLEEHTQPVTSMVKLSNWRLASGSDDNTIKIWNIKSTNFTEDILYKSIATLTGHSGLISCLLQLKDTYLVSASHDGSIKIWDLNTYKCLNSFFISSSRLYSLILLDTNYLITGASTNEIFILSLENSYSLKVLTSIEEHTDTVTCLLQLKGNKNTNKIISGSDDHSIKIWDM